LLIQKQEQIWRDINGETLQNVTVKWLAILHDRSQVQISAISYPDVFSGLPQTLKANAETEP